MSRSEVDEQPRRPLDLRLVGPAAAAWATVGVSLTQPIGRLAWVASAALLLVVVACWRRRLQVAALGLAVLAGVAGTAAHVVWVQHSPVAELAQQRAVVEAQVVLTSDVTLMPRQGVRPELARAPVRLVWLEARGARIEGRVPLRLVASGEQAAAFSQFPAGSTLRLSGRLGVADPGESVAAELRLTGPAAQVSEPHPGHAAINRMRAALAGSMAHSPPHQAGLVPSLVVGDTSRLSPELKTDFQTTGLTHLTAVSGSNLTLLLVFVLTVARWCGLTGRALWVVQVVAVAVFVVLCRAEPSVVRASAMGLVAMAALGRTRDPRRGMRHLSAAVMLLVLIDPSLSRSWGFALSVVATLGILLVAPPLLRACAWLPRSVAEAMAVPMAAQLTTTPLVAVLSGELPMAGLVANIAVAPFVGPATVLGLIAALAGAVWQPLGVPFGWVAGWCVEPLVLVAQWGAGLPGAGRAWPATVPAIVLLTVASLLACVLLPWLLARRWLSLVAALVMVVSLLRPPVVPGWPGPWRVTFCSVGQGDSAVIRAAPGQAMVVDVGPDPRPVLGCLSALGVKKIPLLVLTHFHADHVTGLERVLATREVGTVLVSPLASPAREATKVRDLAARHGATVRVAAAGDVLTVGEAQWVTLRAGPLSTLLPVLDEGESAAENDSSVMGLASSGGLTVLLAGDSEPAAQRAALATLSEAQNLGAQVMAMPHHGSSRQDAEFWRRSGAALAVASSGADNDYGHPAQAALTLARSLGMQVARTDDGSSLSLWVVDGQLKISRAQLGSI